MLAGEIREGSSNRQDRKGLEGVLGSTWAVWREAGVRAEWRP